MAEIIKLTRQDLYDQVWTEPMQTLAARYGLSGVGLAKTCRRMNIPIPGRGYWARKAARQPLTNSLRDTLIAVSANISRQDRPILTILTSRGPRWIARSPRRTQAGACCSAPGAVSEKASVEGPDA